MLFSRPVVRASAPGRYRVQFTIGQESHDKLRRLQALLRREIPTGDPGILFERMLDVYLEKVERAKIGGTTVEKAKTGGTTATGRRRASRQASQQTAQREAGRPVGQAPVEPPGPYGNRIRRAADGPSRHIPAAVKRAVWFRDAGQCAFVSEDGRRCRECSFLELHHIHPYALDGPATVGNISLRCRRHNAYEAEVAFGPRRGTEPRTSGQIAGGASG